MKNKKKIENRSGYTLTWPTDVLVYAGTIREKSSGGIILEGTDSEKFRVLAATEGVLIEIGEKAFAGAREKYKIGDVLCFAQHSADSVVTGIDGGTYFVIKDARIKTKRI
jgi:co-chaperonin GroES (HSP10)